MNFNRKGHLWLFIGIFLTLFTWKYPSEAQVVSDYADKIDLFYKNYPLYHPGSIGTTSRFELNSAYKTLTGLFTNVRTFYTNANFVLNHKDGTGRNKQVAGLTFFSDREGEYFTRSRGYLNYAFHLELKERVYLSAGTSLGLISYGYKSSTASAGGSDNAFNANAGLWLYKEDRFHAGFSIHEIANARLQPIDEQTVLSRYYVLSGDYSLDLGSQYRLTPAAMISVYKNTTIVSGGALLSVYEKLSAGILYKYKQGLLFSLGLSNIALFSGRIDLTFSYKIPSSQRTALNVNAYELNFNYRFFKKVTGEDDYYSEKSRRKKIAARPYGKSKVASLH